MNVRNNYVYFGLLVWQLSLIREVRKMSLSFSASLFQLQRVYIVAYPAAVRLSSPKKFHYQRKKKIVSHNSPRRANASNLFTNTICIYQEKPWPVLHTSIEPAWGWRIGTKGRTQRLSSTPPYYTTRHPVIEGWCINYHVINVY